MLLLFDFTIKGAMINNSWLIMNDVLVKACLLFKEGIFSMWACRKKWTSFCMLFCFESGRRLLSFSFYKIIFSSFCYVFLSLNIASHSGERGLEWNHNKQIRIYIFSLWRTFNGYCTKLPCYLILCFNHILYTLWFLTCDEHLFF